jgi:hypothetical protein
MRKNGEEFHISILIKILIRLEANSRGILFTGLDQIVEMNPKGPPVIPFTRYKGFVDLRDCVVWAETSSHSPSCKLEGYWMLKFPHEPLQFEAGL